MRRPNPADSTSARSRSLSRRCQAVALESAGAKAAPILSPGAHDRRGAGATARDRCRPEDAVNAPLISMLYVPGADAAKLAKVGTLGADAYILDLEDAVAPSAKAAARALVAEAIGGRGGEAAVWVRVNPAASG